MSHILILDDEAVIRSALRRLLERHGHKVSEAGSVHEAESAYTLDTFDLIITDLRMPGPPGTDIIAKVPDVPVLIMTSYASIKSAVDSMKLGAADYIAKPFDHDEMMIVVDRLLRQHAQQRQYAVLRQQLSEHYPVAGMVGSSAVMRAVFDRIEKVAPTDATVLILGESGTGKELVARALHERSHRCEGPIITVNCAAIPANLIESELFGHEKGAFTGASEARRGLVESADHGTLFLDEIGELPQAAQAQLLRVLQEGEIRRIGSPLVRHVDVRLLAATHRDLDLLVEEGKFRKDLYFRLKVVEIELLPLRERGEDVIELAHFLLDKTCRRLNKPEMKFADDALLLIGDYGWPGNVRELENAIERAVILGESRMIGAAQLPLGSDRGAGQPVAQPRENLSLEEYFIRFVREHEGSLTETELARRLGISRKTLWERRQRFGIPRTSHS